MLILLTLSGLFSFFFSSVVAAFFFSFLPFGSFWPLELAGGSLSMRAPFVLAVPQVKGGY